MSVIAFTGFEAGAIDTTTELVLGISGGVSADTETKRTGSYSLKIDAGADSGTDYATLGMPSSANGSIAGNAGTTDVYLNFALYISSLPASDEQILEIQNTGDVGCHIRLDSSGKLSVYDNGDSKLDEMSIGLSTDTWYEVQLKQIYVSGIYELIVDGNSVISGSGASFSSSYWNQVHLGRHVSKNDKAFTVYFDDVVMTTGGFIYRPYYVETCIPNAAGNYSAWTGNYEDVDEIPITTGGGDDYLYAGETNTHSFQCADMTLSGTIAAVLAHCQVRRTYAGDAVKVFLRSGSTDQKVGTAYTTVVPYTPLQIICETDPDTSAVWTSSGVNAAEIGLEATAATGNGPLWGCGQLHVLTAGTARARSRIAYNFGG